MKRLFGFLKTLLRVGLRVYRVAAYIFLALLLVWVVLVTPRVIDYYTASVTLPNGMILKRQFNFTRMGRDDLFAADGRTRLARDIEFVCFNDRYVLATIERGGEGGGLFDGKTGRRVEGDRYDTVREESGLRKRGITCNGYYTGMVGASLLYDGNRAPFLPPCSGRNLKNDSLRNRAWLERPCDPRELVHP